MVRSFARQTSDLRRCLAFGALLVIGSLGCSGDPFIASEDDESIDMPHPVAGESDAMGVFDTATGAFDSSGGVGPGADARASGVDVASAKDGVVTGATMFDLPPTVTRFKNELGRSSYLNCTLFGGPLPSQYRQYRTLEHRGLSQAKMETVKT